MQALRRDRENMSLEEVEAMKQSVQDEIATLQQQLASQKQEVASAATQNQQQQQGGGGSGSGSSQISPTPQEQSAPPTSSSAASSTSAMMPNNVVGNYHDYYQQQQQQAAAAYASSYAAYASSLYGHQQQQQPIPGNSAAAAAAAAVSYGAAGAGGAVVDPTTAAYHQYYAAVAAQQQQQQPSTAQYYAQAQNQHQQQTAFVGAGYAHPSSYLQQQPQNLQHHQHQQQQQQNQQPQKSSTMQQQLQQPVPNASEASPISLSELQNREADIVELAKTHSGCSMLQATMKNPIGGKECADVIKRQVVFTSAAALREVALDGFGVYCLKTLVTEALSRDAAIEVCEKITSTSSTSNPKDSLAYALCTTSLHTRRFIESVMQSLNSNFCSSILLELCSEISRTQIGTLVVQAALVNHTPDARRALILALCSKAVELATDAYGNYVLSKLLDASQQTREDAVPAMWASLKSHVSLITTNKFGSNVVQKLAELGGGGVAVTTTTSSSSSSSSSSALSVLRHAISELIQELFSGDEVQLCALLNDRFGNYPCQAAIAHCGPEDLNLIESKLTHEVLSRCKYAAKFSQNLQLAKIRIAKL